MPTKKTIIIEFPTNTDGALTHQVRNFGEDLWREVEETKLGDLGGIDTIDCSTDRLTVQILHTRAIATVRKLVKKMLRKHFLDDKSKVTYQ